MSPNNIKIILNNFNNWENITMPIHRLQRHWRSLWNITPLKKIIFHLNGEKINANKLWALKEKISPTNNSPTNFKVFAGQFAWQNPLCVALCLAKPGLLADLRATLLGLTLEGRGDIIIVNLKKLNFNALHIFIMKLVRAAYHDLLFLSSD